MRNPQQSPVQIWAGRGWSLPLPRRARGARELTPSERGLLALIHHHRGRCVPYREIEDELGWKRASIDLHFANLRRKFVTCPLIRPYGLGLVWRLGP